MRKLKRTQEIEDQALLESAKIVESKIKAGDNANFGTIIGLNEEEVKKMLGQREQAALENAIGQLHKLVNAEYINGPEKQEILRCCSTLKNHLSDDILRFYEAVCYGNIRNINDALQSAELRAKDNAQYIDDIIKFAIRSMVSKTADAVRKLIEDCIHKKDSRYKPYMSDYEDEAGKLRDNVYDPSGRVFLAFSSADRKLVDEICAELENEKNKLRCFVSYRNLRHFSPEANSGESDYGKRLERALDLCESVVFISTPNSRKDDCEAVTLEMNYVRDNLPDKPRLEYMRDKNEYNLRDCDKTTQEVIGKVFSRKERCDSLESLIKWAINQHLNAGSAREKQDNRKYCLICGTENARTVNYCGKCGKTEFGTYKDWCDVQLEREREQLALEREELTRKQFELDDREKEMRRQVEQAKDELEAERKAKAAMRDEYENKISELRSDIDKAQKNAESERKAKLALQAEYEAALKKKDAEAKSISADNARQTSVSDAKKNAHQTRNDAAEALREALRQAAELIESLNSKAEAETTTPKPTVKQPITADTDGEIQCPACGMKNSADKVFCLKCGRKLAETNYIQCPACGMKNSAEDMFCCKCGRKLTYIKESTDFEIIDKVLVKYTGKGGSVKIPYGVTSIGDKAFEDCSSLTSIEIPNSVKSIGESAFPGCRDLTSIEIPDSVTSIGDGAFEGCGDLASIIVQRGNTKYHSNGNCIIETATKTLIRGCKTSTIPADGSVTSIGNFAFDGCWNLTSIEIPSSVTSIGDYAFDSCSRLTSIKIPNSVTNIGSYTFSGCSSLTSIEIPDSVANIKDFAFQECSSLTSIKYNDTKKQWKAILKGADWKGDTGEFTVYCTDGKIPKHKS